MVFDAVPDGNLLKDSGFEAELDGSRAGAWMLPFPNDPAFQGVLEQDYSTFMSAGRSLHMKMDAGSRLDAVQNVKLEPDTEYTFSYYIKYDIRPNAVVNAIVRAGRNFFLPAVSPVGKADWHRETFSFRTPPANRFDGKGSVRFCIVKPAAEVWIDNVRIEKRKP